MSKLNKTLKTLAPRFSRRRLLLLILRDFRYRPSSIFGRLARMNFRNSRVSSALRIHCCVCGTDGGLSYDFPDIRIRIAHGIGVLRETLHCRGCGATMRDRQLAIGLLQILAGRTGKLEPDLRALRDGQSCTLRILDTDAFSPINRTLRGMAGYVYSQYKPDQPNGCMLADGSVNVNLESMHFPADSFDVILTSDVMEHVYDDTRAHQEIFRCLAPRGSYIFTVPYDPCLLGHRKLTEPTGSGAAYFLLEEEQIHGDPHARSGIVAHRIYGQQLFEDLRAIGYSTTFQTVNQPVNGVFGGDLFIATKGA